MLNFVEKVPATDPVAIPEKREIIDRILEENKEPSWRLNGHSQ